MASAVALAALLITALALVAVALSSALALAALLVSTCRSAVTLTTALLLVALIVAHSQKPQSRPCNRDAVHRPSHSRGQNKVRTPATGSVLAPDVDRNYGAQPSALNEVRREGR